MLPAMLSPASAAALRIGGTGGATALIRLIGKAFTRAGGVDVQVKDGFGSNGSVRAVAEGVLDIGISGRQLSAEEVVRGVVAVPLARTPLVFVTSHPAPSGLRAADLAGLFGAPAPLWPDGTPLNIILRLAKETDSLILRETFPGMGVALAKARSRMEVAVAYSDKENFRLATVVRGSLAPAGLAQFITEAPSLRVVTIDGVAPTVENLEQGRYPYEKRFYLVLPKQPNAAAESFVKFVQSAAGRKLLRENGCLPVEP